jgi:hypothetical protein
MTVQELRQRMTPGEWVTWSAFYLKRAQQRELQAKMRG